MSENIRNFAHQMCSLEILKIDLKELNEGVSTLVVQTEKGSTTLNLSLLVEGRKGTNRVVLRRLGKNTFLTVGLRCRRDLIVGR